MESRVLQAFLETIGKNERPVIVTHGGPIRFLLTKFANDGKEFLGLGSTSWKYVYYVLVR